MESVLRDNSNTNFCLNMAIDILQREVEKETNFVFSPLSFHVMLSLIAAGSKGSTLEQLLLFLGSKSVEELNSLNSRIVSEVLLAKTKEDDTILLVGQELEKGKKRQRISISDNSLTRAPIVSFVNSVWVDQRFGLKTSFEEVARGVYGAKARSVDFVNKGNQVTGEINSWVEEATRGLIKNLLPQDCIKLDTALVFANSLYFKGSWDRIFDASKTENKDFHLLNGQTVQVPFMTRKRYQKHLYGSFDGYKVLKMPYQTGQDTRRFAMYFFLPHSKDGLKNLIQTFNSNPQMHNTEQFELREEDLPQFWIPRFKFSFKIEASNTMKEMGLYKPFISLGEFSEMVDSPELLALSEIFHESFIEVNEEGTEAAASTAPRFIRCCGRLNPPSFVADHPFMFMIKEEISNLIFFVGALLNPLSIN